MFTFVFMLLLFTSLQEAWSIKCWECRSDIDAKCGDPFDNSTFMMLHCDHIALETLRDVKATACRKIRQRFNGVYRIVRSCAFLEDGSAESGEKFCTNRTGRHDILVEYCTCRNQDGCNSE